MRVEDFNNLDRVVDEENDWRHRPDNAYKDGAKAQVSIISTENRDLKATVKMAVDAIGHEHRIRLRGPRNRLNVGEQVSGHRSTSPPDSLTGPGADTSSRA